MPTTPPTFDNSYSSLPERFFSRLPPTAVEKPELIRGNDALAVQLGIDPAWLASDAGVQMVAGNTLPENAEPIATVYAGHQFGSWNPQLGDGRALLLGEVLDKKGHRHDIQLKGSGRTPYSRGGDGRAPLGPVLREYIVSEAMAALGIPTSRSLSAVTTGEPVFREATALPGAVLARVASSHIRIGTMEYFASRGDEEGLKILSDHVIERHYPELKKLADPYLALFEGIAGRQASLLAKWQTVGFIHGVMNTDNMLLCGETIDYGPCAFMDDFDPATVFSSIDHGGRYAYQNQPGIAHWNLSCLARAMLPLFGEDQEAAIEAATKSLNRFPAQFSEAYQNELNRKLGLSESNENTQQLGTDLFKLMAEEHADFTLTFRRLAELANPDDKASIRDLFDFPDAFSDWLERWRELAGLNKASGESKKRFQAMLKANPVFIPRNHLIEEAIVAAVRKSDLQPFHQLADLLQQPYHYDPRFERYALPPTPEQVVPATFCGT